MTIHIGHTVLFPILMFQQVWTVDAKLVDMAGALNRCCASVRAEIRMHRKSEGL